MSLIDFAFIAPFSFYVIIYTLSIKGNGYVDKSIEK